MCTLAQQISGNRVKLKDGLETYKTERDSNVNE